MEKGVSMIRTIENSTLPWDILIILGTGIFSSYYSVRGSEIQLYISIPRSTNICQLTSVCAIYPALNSVYLGQSSSNKSIISILAPLGGIVGSVVFGLLADWKGRKWTYLVLLRVLIGATLGLMMSSSGYNHSMDVLGWLAWWRFVQGAAISGILSATVTLLCEYVV
jgi:MFS family permease